MEEDRKGCADNRRHQIIKLWWPNVDFSISRYPYELYGSISPDDSAAPETEHSMIAM